MDESFASWLMSLKRKERIRRWVAGSLTTLVIIGWTGAAILSTPSRSDIEQSPVDASDIQTEDTTRWPLPGWNGRHVQVDIAGYSDTATLLLVGDATQVEAMRSGGHVLIVQGDVATVLDATTGAVMTRDTATSDTTYEVMGDMIVRTQDTKLGVWTSDTTSWRFGESVGDIDGHSINAEAGTLATDSETYVLTTQGVAQQLKAPNSDATFVAVTETQTFWLQKTTLIVSPRTHYVPHNRRNQMG